MDNLDRIDEIRQCCGRLYCDCPVEHNTVDADIQTILDNVDMIEKELLELWHERNVSKMSEISARIQGYWYDRGKNGYMCSECGCHMPYTTNYCPRCGARMSGGAENG